MAAGVEQLELLGDDPCPGQLPAGVTDGRRQRDLGPLSPLQSQGAAAQQPPTPVERVLAVGPPTEGLLLSAAPDIVDGGLAQAHDVEGVQDAHRLGQAGA
ncbi:MAG: hypothetical protein JWN88_1240 [Frankiales bacterium]|nr:hypothetical protein [Frankiales bacterium]